jgi:hypothetical protein
MNDVILIRTDMLLIGLLYLMDDTTPIKIQ